MSLSALPPELKLHIVEYLPPAASLHFALTCKEHSKLCQSTLEDHAQLFAEWQIIDAGGGRILLWSVLKEVLQDPRQGWYVRELRLPASRYSHWDNTIPGYRPPSQLAVLPEEDQSIFKQAARELEYLYPVIEGDCDEADQHRFTNSNDLIATMEARITAGFVDAIIVILIHHLPNLKTIILTTDYVDCLELTMRRIAAGYKDPTKASKLPLQHLTTALLAQYGSDEYSTADWACYFLCIPSLQTFAADTMNGAINFGGRDGYLLKDATPCSNITELFFSHCDIDMEVILAGTKQLKKLTYFSWHGTDHMKRLVGVIAKHAGHSLEELVLYGDGDHSTDSRECLDSISLRSFQKLKVLNCGWELLHPQNDPGLDVEEPLEHGYYNKDNEPPDFDVRTILPESLEELYLHSRFYEGDDWHLMADYFNSSSASTPNLTLDKVCIRKKIGTWRWDVVFGNAPVPPDPTQSRLAALLESLTVF